jgi:hypothetical protein
MQTSCFNLVAQKLTFLSAKTIANVAEIIENGHKTSSLNNEQKSALDLLRYVNTILENIRKTLG